MGWTLVMLAYLILIALLFYHFFPGRDVPLNQKESNGADRSACLPKVIRRETNLARPVAHSGANKRSNCCLPQKFRLHFYASPTQKRWEPNLRALTAYPHIHIYIYISVFPRRRESEP